MKKTILSLLISVLLAVSLTAAESRYFTGDQQTILAQIPAPPPDDSPAGQADLETVLQVQQDRTPAQVERAKHIDAHHAFSIGQSIFGPDFTARNLPKTESILRQAASEWHVIAVASKKQWSRQRPFQRDSEVKPCMKKTVGTSYPSGHSSKGALWATFYSEAMPEYQRLFTAWMRETMWCRVLAGVHYPSDTQAGKQLGILVAHEMLKNPLTQEAVREMRAEILAFLKDHPKAEEQAKRQLSELKGSLL